jgi:uncharacterized repeat protein (TIGR04076 family)
MKKEKTMEKEKQVTDQEHAAKMERRWKRFQEAQGYSDAEIAKYRADPQKVKAMEKAPKFGTHNIILECTESHNCNAGHKVGDKIIMDGNGVILRDQCPERMCMAVIQTVGPLVYALWERFNEDLDDVNLMLPNVHCPDVGVERGGWGETMWKIYAEPRKKTA